MKVLGLALFFEAKYASKGELGEADYSFGVAINRDKVNVIKNNIIKIIDKIDRQPSVILLRKELSFNPYWKKFNSMINNFVNQVPDLSLKDLDNLSNNFMIELNNFKDEVNFKVKGDKREQFLKVIDSFTIYLDKAAKTIRGLHDLKESPEEATYHHGRIIKRVEESLEPVIKTSPETGEILPSTTPRERPAKYVKPLSDLDRLMLQGLADEIKKEKPYLSYEEALSKAKFITDSKKQKEKDESAHRADVKYRESLSGKEDPRKNPLFDR